VLSHGQRAEMVPVLLMCRFISDLIKRSRSSDAVVLYESAPRLSLADKFFLCRYLTETAGVIMPPLRIREIGIKCLTVTVLRQHRPQSILEHLEGEDWMYELARLEASLSLNHFFSNFCYIYSYCCSLDFRILSLSHSGY